MSQISEIDLPAEYAEDWIPRLEDDGDQPELRPSLRSVVSVNLKEVVVTSTNGTRVRIEEDPITGGLRVTQPQDEHRARGLLTVAPVGVGILVLDDRE